MYYGSLEAGEMKLKDPAHKELYIREEKTSADNRLQNVDERNKRFWTSEILRM